jgi:hypothetical protein
MIWKPAPLLVIQLLHPVMILPVLPVWVMLTRLLLALMGPVMVPSLLLVEGMQFPPLL